MKKLTVLLCVFAILLNSLYACKTIYAEEDEVSVRVNNSGDLIIESDNKELLKALADSDGDNYGTVYFWTIYEEADFMLDLIYSEESEKQLIIYDESNGYVSIDKEVIIDKLWKGAYKGGEISIYIQPLNYDYIGPFNIDMESYLVAPKSEVKISYDNGFAIIESKDQEWLNSLTKLYLFSSENVMPIVYDLQLDQFCNGYVRVPISGNGFRTDWFEGKECYFVAYSDGFCIFDNDIYISKCNIKSDTFVLNNFLVDNNYPPLSVEINEDGDLLLYSDNEDYLNAIFYPDYSLFCEDDMDNLAMYKRSYQNFGYVIFRSDSNYVIKNTLEEPNNIVKHDGYISISKEVMINHNILTDLYAIYFAGCSYYPYEYHNEIDTGLERKEVPDDLVIRFDNGNLILESNDKKYLENITDIHFYWYDYIEDYDFMRNCSVGSQSEGFVYDGNSVIIPKDSLLDAGDVPVDNGETVLQIQSVGYERYINYHYVVDGDVTKDVPDFTYYLDDKYLIVESEDEEWLEALCVSYSNDYGVVIGACTDSDLISNAGFDFARFSFCNTNWSHYHNGIDISKSKIVKDGKKVIININDSVLNGPANVEYLIKLHAYGYKCSDAFKVTFTNASRLLPEDLKIDFKDDGSVVITTNDLDFIDFFKAIRFEGNGSNVHISDDSQINKQNNSITILDVPERFRTGNCIIRIWGNDDSYIVPQYKIYKFTIDYKNIDGSNNPGYFYSGLSSNISNQIEGLSIEDYERIKVLLGDDSESSSGGNGDLTTEINKIVESMDLSAEDRTLIEELLGNSKTIGEVFNIYLDFIIKYGEETIADNAQVTETDEDVYVWVNVDFHHMNDNWVFYRIHKGKLEKVPIEEYDFENNRVLIKSDKFSTFVLVEESSSSYEYTITYNLNGGVNDESNIPGYNKGDSFTFKNPSRPGYSFNGWYSKNGTETGDWGEQIILIDSNSTESLVLNAKWTPIDYSITFNPDGGSLPDGTANPATFTVESIITSLPKPVKDNYVFVGWYDDNGKKIDSIPAGIIGNISITARWKGVEYSYNKQGSQNEWIINDDDALLLIFDRNDDYSVVLDDKTVSKTYAAYIEAVNAGYELEVDGIRLKPNQFDVESGSLKVKLLTTYLNSLSVGTHELKAYFKEGSKVYSTISKFDIKSKSIPVTPKYELPKTGIE